MARDVDQVEDIMCDQRIINLSLDFDENDVPTSAKLRVVVNLISQAVLPTVLNFYHAYFQYPHSLVGNLRDQLVSKIVAFLINGISNSFSSVQRGITYPNIRKSVPKRKCSQGNEAKSLPEKSVELVVLYQPSGEIRGDVIFIHGLHGGLARTWKQGQWRHEHHKLKNLNALKKLTSTDIPPKEVSLKRAFSGTYAEEVPSKISRKYDDSCVNSEGDWEMLDYQTKNDAGIASYSDCWPKDWIPKDCPDVRVIALNYNTDVLWCPVWIKKRNRTGIVERSDEMIQELLKIGVGEQPITWVGHSKGGLFIKQILLNVRERNFNNDIHMENIVRQSKSIMFYSVPHKGSLLADVTLPFLRRSVELQEIRRNCNFVLNQHKRFLRLCNEESFKPEIFSFVETSFTLMSFVFLKIVAYESADPDIGIICGVPLDHREICKPAGRDCFLYSELLELIEKSIN